MKSSSNLTVVVVERPVSLKLTTFEEYVRAAEYLAKSNLVPKEYQGNAANVFVALQYGAEIGLHPMQALQSIAVIGGKPSLYGDAGLAIVQSHPAFLSIKETDDSDTKTATCTVARDGWEPVTRQFSQADAERIQVYEGGGQRALASRTMWRNYPVRMRQMRARWWAMRDCFADALKGMMGREEMEGHDEPAPDQVPDVGSPTAFDDLMPRARVIEEEVPVSAAADPVPVPSLSSTPEQQPLLLGAGQPLVTAPPDSTVFELNGQQFATKGMTLAQMQESLALVGAINARKRGRANAVLHEEFGVPTRSDLTKALAAEYLLRLKAVLLELGGD